jgi:hypothetical protein
MPFAYYDKLPAAGKRTYRKAIASPASSFPTSPR